MGYLDALFTSTSAVCVTGLTVVNTGHELSRMGQVTVMVLIQIGALGIMTMSTLFALLTGRRISLRGRLFLREDLNQGYIAGMVRLARYCLVSTLAIEGLGALSLWICFLQEMPWQKALYYAVFHSVSAFGNAGFDVTGSSLEGYSTNIAVNLIVALLIIFGGLGFGVLVDIYEERSWRRLSLHTKTVLRMTLLLLMIGWAAIGLLEWNNPATLGSLPLAGRVLASFFAAVTPRTAGFNTISTAALSPATLFLLIGLMFVGASPGSTGGGVKTTTIAVILAGLRSVIRGEDDVNLSGRRLPAGDFGKAVAIITLAFALIFLITGILLMTEGHGLMTTIFEVVSAFGTVGLSTGLTLSLSPVGKFLIMATMFCGRIGPMTLALALGQRTSLSGRYRYPEEQVGLG